VGGGGEGVGEHHVGVLQANPNSALVPSRSSRRTMASPSGCRGGSGTRWANSQGTEERARTCGNFCMRSAPCSNTETASERCPPRHRCRAHPTI
jgi:hypothetical protein